MAPGFQSVLLRACEVLWVILGRLGGCAQGQVSSREGHTQPREGQCVPGLSPWRDGCRPGVGTGSGSPKESCQRVGVGPGPVCGWRVPGAGPRGLVWASAGRRLWGRGRPWAVERRPHCGREVGAGESGGAVPPQVEASLPVGPRLGAAGAGRTGSRHVRGWSEGAKQRTWEPRKGLARAEPGLRLLPELVSMNDKGRAAPWLRLLSWGGCVLRLPGDIVPITLSREGGGSGKQGCPWASVSPSVQLGPSLPLCS